jgi:lauroyl/myristoyl acyltransferase
VTLRHALSWKSLFYEVLLPALRHLGPSAGDALLGGLGRFLAFAWPPWRRRLARALEGARGPLGAGWVPEALVPALAANALRFLARDYPLEGSSDDEVLGRFEVDGFESLRRTIEQGRGAILVGSHMGGHIAALHWLERRGVPLRLLVQRPRHVSRRLDRWFDHDGPHPQSGFFLRRDLSPAVAAERFLRARAALRDGLCMYLSGDIPWAGANTRPGRLLGRPRAFLSVWADLAVLTGAPVFFVFCTHRPGGRYALSIEPAGTLAAGEEPAAVARFLARLESEIAAEPADAVAHLLWPCYGPPVAAPPTAGAVPSGRPSRRVAAVARP